MCIGDPYVTYLAENAFARAAQQRAEFDAKIAESFHDLKGNVIDGEFTELQETQLLEHQPPEET